jgi:hypothetical protein
MRKSKKRLHNSAVLPESKLIKQNSQNDRHRELKKDSSETDQHGVNECIVKALVTENQSEFCKTNPWAAQDAKIEFILFESQGNAVHGQIGKYDNIDKGRQNKQINNPASPNRMQQSLFGSVSLQQRPVPPAVPIIAKPQNSVFSLLCDAVCHFLIDES